MLHSIQQRSPACSEYADESAPSATEIYLTCDYGSSWAPSSYNQYCQIVVTWICYM